MEKVPWLYCIFFLPNKVWELGVFFLSLFPFLYKYFLELSIFWVPEQAKAVLETVFILDVLCLASYELTSPKQ